MTVEGSGEGGGRGKRSIDLFGYSLGHVMEKTVTTSSSGWVRPGSKLGWGDWCYFWFR